MIELRGLHLGNIASSPAESVRPDLWPDHAWVPALGCTGGVLYDLCGGVDADCIIGSTVGGSSWTTLGLGGLCGGRVLPVGGGPSVLEGREITVFSAFTPRSLPSEKLVWSGALNSYWGNSMSILSTGACRWYTRDTSTGGTGARNNDITTGTGLVTTDQPVVLAGTYSVSAGRKTIYVNGISRATTTISIDDLTIGQNVVWLWGDTFYIIDSISAMEGDKSALLVAKRVLSPIQIHDLTADPLLPFRRRQPVYYSVPSGGGTARSLIAALTGESATGTISAIIARALSGDVTATSITGAITASMARDLLASMQGQSATGDVAATLQRLLLASLGGASTTGDVAAIMSGLVSLIAAINGQSATGTASATQARALLADLQASSTTPDIAATLAALVELVANISGTTTTPAIAATMARALAANLSGQSTTGAVAVEFAGMLLLVASIAGTSTTGALTATTGRELRAAIATASTTGQVDGQLLRQIAATIAGASLTGSIAAELVNLVSLAASVVGVSVTPAVLAVLSRDLAAEVAAGSTTGEASATVARTLAAAVESGSLTPDNLVLILTGLGILHDTTIISRTPRRGITSRTVRRTIHST